MNNETLRILACQIEIPDILTTDNISYTATLFAPILKRLVVRSLKSVVCTE